MHLEGSAHSTHSNLSQSRVLLCDNSWAYFCTGRLRQTGNSRESLLVHTCMTSRSCMYLRSVSTNSCMILFHLASGPFAGVGITGISGPIESKESWGENAEGGDGGGASSKTSGGR